MAKSKKNKKNKAPRIQDTSPNWMNEVRKKLAAEQESPEPAPGNTSDETL